MYCAYPILIPSHACSMWLLNPDDPTTLARSDGVVCGLTCVRLEILVVAARGAEFMYMCCMYVHIYIHDVTCFGKYYLSTMRSVSSTYTILLICMCVDSPI